VFAVDANAQELGLYTGSVCSIALAWPFVRRKPGGRWSALARASSVFAAVMIVMALGVHGGLYRLIDRLPPFNLFRVPARYLVLAHLGMCAAAAAMLAELDEGSRHGTKIAWRALWPLAIVGALSLLTAAVSLVMRNGLFAPAGSILLGTAVVCAATALCVAAGRGARWAVAALLFFAPVDALLWSMDYFGRADARPLEAFVNSFPDPPEAATGRLSLPEEMVWQNVLTMKGYRLSGGYVALEPARSLDRRSPDYERLAGVSWSVRDGRWARIAQPMSRIRLLPKDSGRAVIVSDRPGRIRAEVEASSRGLVVLSESYHSGWKATVNGRPQSVFRVYGDFIGCFLDPGAKDVEFSFQPESLTWGIRLSAFGLVLLAAAVLLLLCGRGTIFATKPAATRTPS